MDIDFIVPAKACSQRVPRKNFRAFHGDKSLVDITVERLIKAGAEPDRIHLSSESAADAFPVCERHEINFLPRSENLCDNAVPLTTWMRAITAQVSGGCDVAWCQVCDPLFDQYQDCFHLWPKVAEAYDSLVVCHPWRGYLMSENKQPVGWSFGEHHTPSQQLPEWFTMPFTLSILKRSAIERTGYHVGAKPFWYTASGPSIDIDTMEDFEIAQLYYEKKHETRPS